MSQKHYSPETEKLVQERNKIPDEEYQAAQLWLSVDQSRQQNGALHSVAQKYLESAKNNILITMRLPEHKIVWIAQAMDIVIRGLERTEGNALSITDMHRLFSYSGMFDLHQDDEWAKQARDNPANWRTRSAYGDEIERYYVGGDEHRMISYLGEGSRFTPIDVNQICQDLWSQGVINLTNDRKWALVSAKR